MKRKLWILFLATVLLVGAVLTVCSSDAVRLRWAINRYQSVLDGELSEDLTLTIYYLPHYILTRKPLTVEELREMTDTVKIVVESDELECYLSTLRKLDSSAVQPAREKFGLNALVYYVFGTGNSEKLLEVVMQQFVGNSQAFGAFVNGIPVEKNPILYELLMPFLSAEECEEIGIPEQDVSPNSPVPLE